MALKRSILGKTGIEVTELCFGALPMGPLQKNLPSDAGAALVEQAIKGGVNFVDTAQAYRTYGAIRQAMKATGIRPIIATKSMATDYESMEAAIQEALSELEVEYLDIFHLHAARAGDSVFKDRKEALRCLLHYKEKGVIRAIGIATHDVKVTAAAADQEMIDVVFPLYNRVGMGILRGTVEEMAAAIRQNIEAGKGVYLMKALAGGSLIGSYEESMGFVRQTVPHHAVALGMTRKEEVEFNIGYFTGVNESFPVGLEEDKHMLVVPFLCKGCGACIPSCHSSALELKGDKAQIDTERCIRCGYCTPHCPEFAIRMV